MLAAPLVFAGAPEDLHAVRESRLLFVVGFVLLAAALVNVARRRSLLSLAGFGVVWVLWLAVNGRVEGPTLFRVSHRHGVTWADLVPVVLLCVVLVVTHSQRRGRMRLR